MSVKVNYNGNEILSLNTNSTKKLTTSGEYCEDDIEIVNTQDGGMTPSGSIEITENGTYDVTEKAEAVVSVGGGVNLLLYASDNCQRLFQQQTLPNNFAVEFGANVARLNTSSNGCFTSTQPEDTTLPSELSVKCNGTVTVLGYAFYETKFKKVILDFDTSHITNWNRTFSESKITEIVGLIDMTSATDVSSCFGNAPIKTMHFKPNTIPLSLMFRYSGSMTKETVISLANGLDGTVTGQNLSYFATTYATKLATLGTVSMDETNTYHIFTEDAGGDTTLQDFITDVKGWTIA